MAGRFAADLALGRPLRALPRETALGSLCHYISAADLRQDYQPANITFDLLPALDDAHAPEAAPRQTTRATREVCRRAIEGMERYLDV